jgi:L-amino acid N-acyltransferase YncA
MTELLVRTATHEDAPALFALPNAAITHARDFAELIHRSLKHYPFLVAERQGRIIGYAYARAHRSLAAYRWSVDACVDALDQPPEVLRTLYEALIAHLREQGFMAIYAAVSVHDRDSAELHKSLGFAPLGLHQSIDLQCEADYWCMTLAPAPRCAEPVSFHSLHTVGR